MKVVIASLALAGASGFLVAPSLHANGRLSESVESSTLDVHEANASASLFGQFRTNASAWLWLRTDLYLHGGVEMRPLTADEIRSGRQADRAASDDGLKEEQIVTVVPAAERDFRGIFGNIERAVNAYKPMMDHEHQDPEKALPLFRLMTWIDPSFTRGWTVGASILARRDADAGLAYLQEGLRNMPDSLALLAETGAFWAGKKNEPKYALTFFERAMRLGEARFANGLGDPDSDEAAGFLSALQWSTLCYREVGKLVEMERAATAGLRFFPGDPILERGKLQPPKVLTEKGRLEWLESVVDATIAEAKGKESGLEPDHDEPGESGHEGHNH